MTDLPAIASAGNRAEVARGRSLESVGQRAKSALAEMRVAGQDTPRNANGVVASAALEEERTGDDTHRQRT